MKTYPLIFRFEDAVSGRGFVARILTRGSILALHEDGEWWLSGVQPGGVAEVGDDFWKTQQRFRTAYRDILFQAAPEAAGFSEFKAEVDRFFAQVDEHEANEWLAIARALGQGRVRLEPPFDEFEHEASLQFFVNVTQVNTAGYRPAPTDNKPDLVALPKVA